MRTVNLHLDINKLPFGKVTNDAIGYLATWGFEGYDTVDISHEFGSVNDMIAVYTLSTKPGGVQFVIGAHWNVGEERYSFHS